MAREAKIKGRVETAVDEQSLRRGTDRIREAMDTATDVVPQLDSSRLRRRMERMVPGATTARRGVQTLMDRRGSGDEGGGDSRSGGSGSDDGGSATAGAAGMEIQAEQLEGGIPAAAALGAIGFGGVVIEAQRAAELDGIRFGVRPVAALGPQLSHLLFQGL